MSDPLTALKDEKPKDRLQEPIQEAKPIDETAQFIEELKQTIKLHENRLEELKKLITDYDSRLDAKIEELVDLMIKRLK